MSKTFLRTTLPKIWQIFFENDQKTPPKNKILGWTGFYHIQHTVNTTCYYKATFILVRVIFPVFLTCLPITTPPPCASRASYHFHPAEHSTVAEKHCSLFNITHPVMWLLRMRTSSMPKTIYCAALPLGEHWTLMAASQSGVVAPESCFADRESYKNFECWHCDDTSVVRANVGHKSLGEARLCNCIMSSFLISVSLKRKAGAN